MLLFETISIQTISAKLRSWKFNANRDIILYNSGCLMPTKTACRDYNKLIPGAIRYMYNKIN